MAVIHVDDILHAGEKTFEEKVLDFLKQSIAFGSEEEKRGPAKPQKCMCTRRS